MKQTLILNYHPTDLNKYINGVNKNRFAGNVIKQVDTMNVYWSCKEQGLKPMYKQVKVDFYWYAKNKRKDPDNMSFKKAILDGIVKAGVLTDDGWDEIIEFSDHFILDTDEQVIIDIIEV